MTLSQVLSGEPKTTKVFRVTVTYEAQGNDIQDAITKIVRYQSNLAYSNVEDWQRERGRPFEVQRLDVDSKEIPSFSKKPTE